ncbi:hypothetical protein P692DRAFT_20749460 [Suillus brevipes Sb2]|nr:hypothetical protein P692DRAFT_20749460 [Suillus brevipes Sb2]
MFCLASCSFLTHFQGNLVSVVDTLPFIGYITVGQEFKLCPLYCSPLGLEDVHEFFLCGLTAYLETRHIHASVLKAECTEVLLYTMEVITHPPASLDLPAKWTRQGQDNKIHIIYKGIVGSFCNSSWISSDGCVG